MTTGVLESISTVNQKKKIKMADVYTNFKD